MEIYYNSCKKIVSQVISERDLTKISKNTTLPSGFKR